MDIRRLWNKTISAVLTNYQAPGETGRVEKPGFLCKIPIILTLSQLHGQLQTLEINMMNLKVHKIIGS